METLDNKLSVCFVSCALIFLFFNIPLHLCLQTLFSMNPQVSNAPQQRKNYRNTFKMTTTTGYKVSSHKTSSTASASASASTSSSSSKPTPTRASDCVDEASDASLFCNQEPLPTPRAAPRPRNSNANSTAAPTPKPRSGKLNYFSFIPGTLSCLFYAFFFCSTFTLLCPLSMENT